MPTEPDIASLEPLAARARGVSLSYPGNVDALTDTDVDIPKARITAFIGPNGSGKTSLLRVLGGLLRPGSGTVETLGVRQPADAARREGRCLRSQLSYVAQDAAVDPEMTGRETLELLAALHGVNRSARGAAVLRLAETFGLNAVLSRAVSTYSGGERRRLHLAGGLVSDAELLLLDEPLAGIDADGRTRIWAELVRRSSRGRHTILVTHDLTGATEHADRVALFSAGRVLVEDAPAALIAKHAQGAKDGLREVYRELTGTPLPAPPSRGPGRQRGA